MKKLSLYIIALLFALPFASLLKAQNTTSVKFISPTQIKDIYEIGNDAAVFSHLEYRSLDKVNVFQLAYLDASNTKQYMEVDADNSYYGMHSSGTVSFFVFKSRSKQELTIISVKNKTQSPVLKTINYSEKEVYSGIKNITATPNNKLFIVRGYSIYDDINSKKRKLIEVGDHVSCIDEELNFVGGEKYPIDLTERYKSAQSFYGTKNGLVIGYETYELSKKRYAAELVMFNNQAQKTGTYNLVDEEGVNFPSRIISDNNKIIISGFRMEGRIFNSKNSDGLFVTIIGADGKLESTSLYSWDAMKEKLKNSGRAGYIFNTQMKVLVEDIVPTESGYRVICESFSSSRGNNATKVALGVTDNDQHVITVQDFVVFETDKSGQLVSSNIIEKEKMNIQLNGTSRSMRYVQLANLLRRSKVFPYVGITGNKIKFINYTNHEGFLSVLDLATGSITKGKKIELEPVFEVEVNEKSEAMVNNSKFLTKMSKLESGSNKFADKMGKGMNKLAYAIENVDYVFEPWKRRDFGYFAFTDGKTLIYKVNPERHEVFYENL